MQINIQYSHYHVLFFKITVSPVINHLINCWFSHLNLVYHTSFFFLPIPSIWSCRHRVSGLADTEYLVLPVPSIWSCRYRVSGLAGTEYLVLPIPSIWSCRYRVSGLAATEYLVLPIPSIWSCRYRVSGLADTKYLVLPIPLTPQRVRITKGTVLRWRKVRVVLSHMTRKNFVKSPQPKKWQSTFYRHLRNSFWQ